MAKKDVWSIQTLSGWKADNQLRPMTVEADTDLQTFTMKSPGALVGPQAGVARSWLTKVRGVQVILGPVVASGTIELRRGDGSLALSFAALSGYETGPLDISHAAGVWLAIPNPAPNVELLVFAS